MNFVFNTVTDAGIAGLGIVSDLGIAPGAGLVATALHSIKENCEQIVTHKADCRRLANTAAQLYNLFEEQTKQLEKTPLRPATDEVEQVLLDVREKTLKWASYGRIRAFRYEKTIGDGIKQCHTELENSVRGFQIAAVVSLAAAQKEQMEQMQYNHQEVVERLNQHQEIAERFNKLILTASKDAIIKRGPDPQAEPLLELGHERLREMRDYLNNMTGELRINGQTTTRATFNTTYLRTQDVLSALHTATKLLPNIKSLNGEVVKDGNMPYAGGSFSDVWIGIWLGDRKVALKCLRGIKNTSSTAKRRFENEIKIWSKLQHPNVLSFLGMVTDVGAYLALVSPWQENGNIFK
ncbi:hypothetical protein PHLCEN_2v2535 [Hermanssonia centrifuga]|uniref:Protein kinase domain-containing protein n=1 Tax=Hermanssonia centrifuga TaxID=98765 RepID=A0A2R6RLK3_9APHY|nr:hypothetical protein PHLCEN_2v2535 [Hermanssonia centrifuga]